MYNHLNENSENNDRVLKIFDNEDKVGAIIILLHNTTLNFKYSTVIILLLLYVTMI